MSSSTPHASCNRTLSVRVVTGCEIWALLTKPTREVWQQSCALVAYLNCEVAGCCCKTAVFKLMTLSFSSGSCIYRRYSGYGPDLQEKMQPFFSFFFFSVAELKLLNSQPGNVRFFPYQQKQQNIKCQSRHLPLLLCYADLERPRDY